MGHRAEVALIGLGMALGVYGLGYRVGQADFGGILAGFLVCFGLYAWALAGPARRPASLKVWLTVGLLLRLVLLFSFPALSDDVYRFIWDGRLMVQGYNPFDQLPAWYLEPAHRVEGLDEDLFDQLNSPRYFTVYPPVAQATFALAAWLFPTDMQGSVVVMKLLLLACELGTVWVALRLLRAYQLPRWQVLLYWLNPLIIVEVMGNLHYEGAMIFFLLLGLWALQRARWLTAGGAFALGIASKLVPLIFLPLLLRRMSWRALLLFFLALGGALALAFYPLLSGLFFGHFSESLDLYFRKFEFNGSVYYLLRWVGFQRVGYNMIARIGPTLAGLTAALIFGWALWERRPSWKTLPLGMLVAVCIFLALATTVHPWYVATPVALCMFTRWRFPLVWSGMVVLTYINYSYTPYWENLWVVVLEYLVVGGVAIWEIYQYLPERGRGMGV